MKNINTIFRFEWQQLVRGTLMRWLLLLLTACSCYAIYYGNQSIGRQVKNIAFLEHLNDSTKQAFHNYFTDKQVADSMRFGWASMNSLYDGITTEDYLGNNMAVNKPNRLSHLSIGQRDVYPVYRKVTARSLYYDGSGLSLDDKYAETNNPHKLLAGNFDLSFVFLYLFPLLIIALCYNILSQEKEQGTFPILNTQPISLRQIIAYKFLFKFILIIGLVVIYSLLGYLFSPVKHTFPLLSFLSWLAILTGYMLFWFAIVFLIVSFKYNSSVSALSLTGFWMLFLIIIPSLINNYVAANYKISSRIRFVKDVGKEISSLWDLDDSILLPAYYKAYPQYADNPIKALWSKEDSFDSLAKNEDTDSRYNKRIIVWHYILDYRIKKQLVIYNQQILNKLSAAEKFTWLNPVVTTQEALNDISASGYRQNQQFRNATAAYQDTVFNTTNRFIFGDKKLTLDDYKSYPAFRIDNTSINIKEVISAIALLLVLSGFFIGLGVITFNKKNND